MPPAPLLYLSAFSEAHQSEYYERLLGVSLTGARDGWLVFFLGGVVRQASDALTRAVRLQAPRERYRCQVRLDRTAAHLLRLVDLLLARPVSTARQVKSSVKVDFPTALRYVHRLVKAELLREITGKGRNRVYRADEVLQAIESPIDTKP